MEALGWLFGAAIVALFELAAWFGAADSRAGSGDPKAHRTQWWW